MLVRKRVTVTSMTVLALSNVAHTSRPPTFQCTQADDKLRISMPRELQRYFEVHTYIHIFFFCYYNIIRLLFSFCCRFIILFRGAIVNRTYGVHKNLYI